jgi:hypothetical protein
MNRKERRAEKARNRKQVVANRAIIAIHEAGHAVARFITAPEMGLEEDHAITEILVHSVEDMERQNQRIMRDGRAGISSAVTYGPSYSVALDALTKSVNAKFGLGAPGETTMTAEIYSAYMSATREAFMAADRAEIERWLSAEALICVFGALSEAAYLRRSFWDIWDSLEAENDARDFAQACVLASVPPEEIPGRERAAVERGVALLQSNAWPAVIALANRLTRPCRIDGKEAAAIIRPALTARWP